MLKNLIAVAADARETLSTVNLTGYSIISNIPTGGSYYP